MTAANESNGTTIVQSRMTYSRREFLLTTSAAAVTLALGNARPAHASALTPTPRVSEGPFYPQSFPADVDNDLTRVAGKNAAAKGTVLDVTGRVIDTSGKPIANTRIEIWQCDATGTYHHVGYEAGDDNFQGFGATTTDADGRYRFRTIKPVAYPGRTPHIHYIVKPQNGKRLTSQMFIEGEAQNERDFLYRAVRDVKERERLVMKVSGGATLTGILDVVL
jgi:protocatechuate 3,4-dioxygenase, beta subunit